MLHAAGLRPEKDSKVPWWCETRTEVNSKNFCATCSWSSNATLALSRAVGPNGGASGKTPLLHVMVMDEDEDEEEHCHLYSAAQIENATKKLGCGDRLQHISKHDGYRLGRFGPLLREAVGLQTKMLNKRHMTVRVHDIPVEFRRWTVHRDGIETLEWRQVEHGLRSWLLLRFGCDSSDLAS